MKKYYKTLLCSAILIVITGQASAKLSVVTTTQDLAAITKEMGGQHIDVHSLTLGTRDPHYAVAKPSMIRRVYKADLLLVIGVDMEIGWLPPLLQSARNSRVQPGNPGYLDLSQSVSLLGQVKGSVTRAMGDVHGKGNPHYWLDPRNGVRMAKVIADRLAQLDSENATVYLSNYQTFKKALNIKIKQWQAALHDLKNKPVIAYHTSFVYLADAFAFNIVDEVEPKPGIAPGASSLSQLISKIKKDQIRLLIIEPYYERRSVRYLNQQTGIQVAIVPQSVGAEPGIQTYTELFDNIVKVLQAKGGK